MALNWLDPTSPPVRSAVVSGGWGRAPHSAHGLPVPGSGEIDPIAVAVAHASERLSTLTGLSVHPAGTAIERYTAEIHPMKLRLAVAPARLVQTVTVRGPDGTMLPVTTAWFPWGQNVEFQRRDARRSVYYSQAVSFSDGLICSRDGSPFYFEVRYRFGSTITADAREAVITLAHQYWLSSSRCEDCDECTLPDNATSVTRDGISYTLDAPTGDTGYDRAGVAEVDRWVTAVNPRRARATAGVWAPDAVPGVIVSLVDARPTWAA